jgi:putative Flp pilus-assembly TadE/G-like protein
MQGSWLRKQSGQAVVLVAVAVLVLTAILALALDGGGIYLDKRQLQNAVDAAALAGAEQLMAVPSSYSSIHNQGIGNLVKNIPGTSIGGTVCSVACPSLATIGLPGGTGIGTIVLGAGYFAELEVPTSYTYRVTLWHTHPVAVAPIHGFQSTITLSARATAQNANLPYAVVLLQDKPAYSQFSNFNINGTPGGITLNYTGSNPNDRGGIFSNASIAPGNGTPSITFSPGGNQGDLWAVNESASDRTALNQPGRVVGFQAETAGNLPFLASHLDFPTYPEPPPPNVSYNGSTVVNGPPTLLCPGKYTNQITVQNGGTALLYPGVYQVQANGVDVQGTLRTLQPSDFTGGWSATCGGQTINAMPSDPGVIIEVTPDNMSGSTLCNKHIFAAEANSNITLTPSPKYFNISLYIETMPNWQTTCTNAPLGTNVVRFAGGACYSIGGAIYGPADNMVLTGSGCGTGVGQIVAWTLLINGNGTVNETFNPASVPYMKGLTQ